MKLVVFIAETYVQLVRYQSMCYSTGASGPTALSVCSRLCLVCYCSYYCCSVLYCTMPFIATCVDTIGMVFWDRPVLRYPGKALILVAKQLLFTLADTQVFLLVDLLYFQWGSLGPLRMVGKLNIYVLGCDEVTLLDGFNFFFFYVMQFQCEVQ